MKLFLALSLFIGFATEAYSQNHVTIYADCNYSGENKSLGAGYHNMKDLGSLNDKVSCIRIPDGWSVTVFSDPDYRGNQAVYKYSIDCIQNNMNDKSSSILIEKPTGSNNNQNNSGNPPNSNIVTIFRDCNYSGQSLELGLGYHNIRELGNMNDKLSSIYIPAGYIVTLYKDPDFKGANWEVYQNESCITKEWDDKVSSLLITKRRN